MPKLYEDCIHTIEIKKSKFITYLHRCESEDEAREYIRSIKKEHPQANHHCSAMIIQDIMRSNDDGEPSQTAGHPMLDCLMHHHMQNIVAVVVRYFGGIKLGTGGLVRAYSSSVQEALQHATLTKSVEFTEYEISFPYDLIGKVDHYLRSHQIEITFTDYNENVLYHILVLEDITKDLQELSNGSIHPIPIQKVIHEQIIR